MFFFAAPLNVPLDYATTTTKRVKTNWRNEPCSKLSALGVIWIRIIRPDLHRQDEDAEGLYEHRDARGLRLAPQARLLAPTRQKGSSSYWST